MRRDPDAGRDAQVCAAHATQSSEGVQQLTGPGDKSSAAASCTRPVSAPTCPQPRSVERSVWRGTRLERRQTRKRRERPFLKRGNNRATRGTHVHHFAKGLQYAKHSCAARLSRAGENECNRAPKARRAGHGGAGARTLPEGRSAIPRILPVGRKIFVKAFQNRSLNSGRPCQHFVVVFAACVAVAAVARPLHSNCASPAGRRRVQLLCHTAVTGS